MLKNLYTILKIKLLKKKEVNEKFLQDFRAELKSFIVANPSNIKTGFSLFSSNLNYMPIPIIIALIALISGGGTAFASLGSLPGERLYTVKTLTEEVRSALTFDDEAEAKLQSKFASERLKEVNALLKEKGVEAPGIKIAMSRLEDHLKKAEDIIEKEKSRGVDTTRIENEIEKEIQGQREILKNSFASEKTEVKNDIRKIQLLIQEAKKTGSSSELVILEKRLEAEKERKKTVYEKNIELKQNLNIKIEEDDKNIDEDDNATTTPAIINDTKEKEDEHEDNLNKERERQIENNKKIEEKEKENRKKEAEHEDEGENERD